MEKQASEIEVEPERTQQTKPDLTEAGLEAFTRVDEDGVEHMVVMRGDTVIYRGDDRRQPEPSSVNKEDTPLINHKVEDSVFGKWSVVIRNTAGAVSTLVVCITSLGFWWTAHQSVTQHSIWPDTTTILFTNIGPVMIAWAVINVNKTLTSIFGGKDSLDFIKERFSKVVKK